MILANPSQNIFDWVTQQWVMLRGRKIDAVEYGWLLGPFGDLKGIGEEYILRLAEKEQLTIDRNPGNKGLLSSIETLGLSGEELDRLSPGVSDFYEHTSCYKLDIAVHWNPLFKIFGLLVNRIFSRRLRQLNIPIQESAASAALVSKIITLHDSLTNNLKYTIWLRNFRETGEVVYSGIYDTCALPSGLICVKAIFPLPNGNATVLMKPSVGPDGELILDASGRRIGDPGFYFLLQDSRGNFWTRYLPSFTNKLVVSNSDSSFHARQTLHLWKQKVVSFNYTMETYDSREPYP